MEGEAKEGIEGGREEEERKWGKEESKGEG